MLLLNKCLIFASFLYGFCDAYKLLVVFGFPAKSHSILGAGYVRHLLKAGHEVTYITPILIKDPAPNLRQIDVSSNIILFPPDIFNLNRTINAAGTPIFDPDVIFYPMMLLTKATVMHNNVQQLMNDPKEKFDAVIAEWMYSELYAGFSSVFNCPMIWSSSMEPHFLVLSIIDDAPNPAYNADVIGTEVPPFTFIQRAEKLWSFVLTVSKKWLFGYTENNEFHNIFSRVVERRGRKLPPFEEVKYNGSLMLGNSHVAAGAAIRLPQNYVPIAGYHIVDELKPLPNNLQAIMDNAKNGVIYFSLGSVLKSNSLPEKIKTELLAMFGELKQTVIWKFEEKLDNLPSNVNIVDWVPQPSILAHKNCILFISHGGLLSTIETLYYGVPIIGMPMFADQFPNVNRAVSKGFAKRVDLNYDVADNLKETIQEILGNPSYSKKAKELSLIYHDRPVPPGKELVHWVEHVVRTRGAPHLRSPALLVPWYQKMYMDLAAVILAVILVTRIALKRLFRNTKMKSD